MTTLTSPTIRVAGPSDVAAVARILADGFTDDPVFAWCIPDRDRRVAVLPAFFELVTNALLEHRRVHVAGSDGAALWVPPDQPPIAEADAPAFEAALTDLLGPDMERTAQIIELLESNHPTNISHDYLWLIGVAAGSQGRGIGTAMLSWALSDVDAAMSPAYLEATSPRNRALYQRHGFEVVAEISVPGGPPLWPMWREARIS